MSKDYRAAIEEICLFEHIPPTGVLLGDAVPEVVVDSLLALIHQARVEVFDRIAGIGRPYGQFKDWKQQDIANFFVSLGELEREFTQPGKEAQDE